MNKELKEKWVEALRSGEFKQGQQALYHSVNNTYCCLGVLCKIQEIEIRSAETICDQIIEGTANSATYAMLARDLGQNKLSILANKNDSGGTFKSIADWIEENL